MHFEGQIVSINLNKQKVFRYFGGDCPFFGALNFQYPFNIQSDHIPTEDPAVSLYFQKHSGLKMKRDSNLLKNNNTFVTIFLIISKDK